jgi:hypothetical protein
VYTLKRTKCASCVIRRYYNNQRVLLYTLAAAIQLQDGYKARSFGGNESIT